MMADEKFKKISTNFVTDDTNFMKSFRHNVLLYVSEGDITIKDLKDCKISTAVALAKALGVGLNELVGLWHINHQHLLYTNQLKKHKR
ncbi:MAG: hypothetical protein IJF07_00160 [Lachnospiraceae bacterium]|nr:hypothetical protein [Lachnospiraceae bacterium]